MSDPPVTLGSIEVEEGDTFHSLRRDLGVQSFGINLITLQPRQRNRVHRHEHQEEVYLVLDGTLTLIAEGEDIEMKRGAIARVPPETRRQLANRSGQPVTILALGGYGEHEPRDALAWTDWDEDGPGRSPRDVPPPEDLPADDG